MSAWFQVETVPFGRWLGRSLNAVPSSWLLWLLATLGPRGRWPTLLVAACYELDSRIAKEGPTAFVKSLRVVRVEPPPVQPKDATDAVEKLRLMLRELPPEVVRASLLEAVEAGEFARRLLEDRADALVAELKAREAVRGSLH